ncbi:MAG TPA: hypothetical protein ENH85_12140 [Candidatus Scalindua sp.]|nr:hypothetical protein [Candidatus Scalindua sp.]
MIVSIHHIKCGTIVMLISSILALLALTSNVSMAQVSDPTRRDERKAETVDLKECIEMAIENNLQIATARKGLGIADADRIKASLLLPSNPEVKTEIGARESSSERHTDYTIALSQEIEVYC